MKGVIIKHTKKDSRWCKRYYLKWSDLFFELDSRFSGDIFRSRLSEHGVRCSGTSKQRVRMACHLDVSKADIERAAEFIRQVLHEMEGESS